MNELQIFNNPEFGRIRTVEIDGEPWLVGKDVAKALGYKDTKNALKAHVDPGDKGGWQITTPSGTQDMTVINESGVYSLIFSSKLKKAKAFKRWVTSEVLPAIRKQGGYLSPEMVKSLQSLTDGYKSLTERVEVLERGRKGESLPEPPEGNGDGMGPATKRQWMRTFNWKLELLAELFDRGTRKLLGQLYEILERVTGAALEEERQRVMEERGLEECSILTAVFYTPRLRKELQVTMDYNLPTEDRGW